MIDELKARINHINDVKAELQGLVNMLRIKYGDAIHLLGWRDDPLDFIVCVDLDKLPEDETIDIDPYSN